MINNKAKNSRLVNLILGLCGVGVLLLFLNFENFKKGYQNKQGEANRKSLERHFGVKKHNDFFVMHFENDSKELNNFYEISKPLIEALKYEYTGLEYEWPLHAYFFNSQEAYLEFLENVLELKIKPTGGVYLTHYQAFFSYQQAGLSVWTHEILHPILDATYGELPLWADEGLPAYGEVYYIYQSEGVFLLDMGYHHPGRLFELKDNLKNISLRQVLCCSENTSEKRLVAMFLQKNGVLQKYLLKLKQAKKQDSESKEAFVFEVFDSSPIEVEKLWSGYLDSLSNELPSLFRKDLPSSLEKQKASD